jgi:hypothetical protein
LSPQQQFCASAAAVGNKAGVRDRARRKRGSKMRVFLVMGIFLLLKSTII